MKRFVSFLSLMLVAVVYAAAQQVVKGTVTDKDGNPIPGVKVEAVGGTESTLTELDGTFVLETRMPAKKVKVHYVGMQPKEQKVEPDMVIRMSKSNWWNEKPDKYRWFLGVQVGIPTVNDIKPAFGLMIGRVKQIGWYVKGVFNPVPEVEGTIRNGYSINSYWLTGNLKQSYWNVTGGVIARLWSPVHVYAGAGYSERTVAWETFGGGYMELEPDTYNGVAVECGLMLKIKKVLVNMGTVYNNRYFVGNFGIGYCF